MSQFQGFYRLNMELEISTVLKQFITGRYTHSHRTYRHNCMLLCTRSVALDCACVVGMKCLIVYCFGYVETVCNKFRFPSLQADRSSEQISPNHAHSDCSYPSSKLFLQKVKNSFVFTINSALFHRIGPASREISNL